MKKMPKPGPVQTDTAEFARDPAGHYATLRQKCPISWQGFARSYLATRHDDVVETLRHPKMEHLGIIRPWLYIRDTHGFDFPLGIKVITAMPFNYEGSVHAKRRRYFAKGIAPFAEQDDMYLARARRLLDKAKRDGGMDFAEDFANRLLFDCVCDLAEIGEEERAVLYPMSRVSWAAEATVSMKDRGVMERTLEPAFEHLTKIIPGLLARSPDSFLSSIYHALPDDEPDKISATIVLLCVILMMGNDAMGGSLNFSVRWLLDEQRNGGETIAQEKWGALSEEFFRYAAPVDFLTRVATETVTIGGTTLEPGERMMTSPFSANHDPAKFGPHADRISLDHHFGSGLTFGAGRHLCLGLQMSRSVGRAATRALAELPAMKLAGPSQQARGKIIRTLATMPVSLT